MKYLLLDDHPLFRKSLRQFVESLNPKAEFWECDNVTEAEVMQSQHPPDFVIADIELLDTVCFDFIQQIKQKHPSVPVLVLSMHEDSQSVNLALEAGADGYITKRDDPEELKKAIMKLLNNQKYLSQTASSALVHSIQNKPEEKKLDVRGILSAREYEIFLLLGKELSRKEIASQLHISDPTVNTHIERMKRKLDMESTHKLLCLAIKTKTQTPATR